METVYERDVLVIACKSDGLVANEIITHLRAALLRAHLCELDGNLESTDLTKISTETAASRVLLLVVSAQLLGAPWEVLEEQILRFRDPAEREIRRFIPIRLNEINLPISLRHLEFLDWSSESKERILKRLPLVCERPKSRPTFRGANVKRLSSIKRRPYKNSLGIRTLRVDPEASLVVCGSLGGEILVHSLTEGGGTQELKLVGHKRPVTSMALDSSRSYLVSSSQDRTIRLWSLKESSCVSYIEGVQGGVNCVGLSETAILCGSMAGVIHVLDIKTTESKALLRGHTGAVNAIMSHQGNLLSAGADGTVRVWEITSGKCIQVLEGHTKGVRCLKLSSNGSRLLSGSDDKTIRLWDLDSNICLNVFDAHTDSVTSVAWHDEEKFFVSGGGDRIIRMWNSESGELLRVLDGHGHDVLDVAFHGNNIYSGDFRFMYQWILNVSEFEILSSAVSHESSLSPSDQVQYTNAKVLLVGDSGAGKTALSIRLASGKFERDTVSTVGAWATQWSLPASGESGVDREIWLWDFGGQADQRLIHQLYMDETALAVLVFDAQRNGVFDSLNQWNQDLARSTDQSMAKLLVAGRVDASPVRVSRNEIVEYCAENGFLEYIETSALTNQGCDDLKSAVISSIDWDRIPWRSSPILFKKLKEEIVNLKDSGRVLMRFNELRDALRLRLPEEEINFSDSELRAVLSLLAGPGVVLELEFGAWILFQPELINTYGQAVIATMRADKSELGCISEQKVLSGDLVYGGFPRISKDDERFVLLEMHRKLLQRGLCSRELTEKDVVLVFPSYYKRNRPELTGHPAVLVSYRFDGVVDEVYATLVVRLDHTNTFRRKNVWQDAAEFASSSGGLIGIKLTRNVPGAAAIVEIYGDSASIMAERILFSKYVHDHLINRASNVIRRRHYVCSCGHPVSDLNAAERRRQAGKDDVGCAMCDGRVKLVDELEELYSSAEIELRVQSLETKVDEELDNESKERMLVGEVISMVASAGQISREKNVSDHGVDMEIEFKDSKRNATGKLIFLQLKSGDSYLRKQADGKEYFFIKNDRHAGYWANQIAPVMLVVRGSNGRVRWMEIRDYLTKKIMEEGEAKKIMFHGEDFNVKNILKWRDSVLRLRG